ncbi:MULTISPECIES: hypothetical protein [unclassified Streptomyces]|uniref:hypothetical protein n=1 Tax=unclassified Streptomyces TaxID=2593676 RepID=UPI00278BB484|nr:MULTISPECIES: hypothetical protein [unclassified Streptomyces]
MTDRNEYIDGLRQLADWLESNEGAPTPYVADILLPLTTNQAVEEYAASHGLEVRYSTEGNAKAVVSFGPIEYHAYGYADWDRHIAEHSEQQARTWADKNDMTIQPREAGEAS